MSRIGWVAGFGVALVAGAACQSGPGRQRCRLSAETLVATSPDARLGAIALAARGDGRKALVAWSDGSSTRATTLDVATGRHGEVHVALAGGASALAAEADGDGWRLAAVTPDDAKSGGGNATLVTLGWDASPRARETLGPAGVESRDVSLLRGPAGWIVAWHDGTPGTFALRLWAAGRRSTITAALPRAPLAPSLARDRRGVALAWAELDMTALTSAVAETAQGGLRTWIRFARLSPQGVAGKAKEVGVSKLEGADPVLVADGDRLRVVYRDEEDGDGRAEYFVADARPGARRYRVSRANGRRSPSVVHCRGTLAAAAIRTFQGEYLVGFNRFDARAAKHGGELQIYSDGVHFGEAALVCLPKGYALAYAEEGERSRLLFSRAGCGDPP